MDETKEEGKEGVRTTLKTFCESTSVKGVPKVLKTQQKTLKIIWFVAVIIGASVAFFQLTTLVVRYLQYESVSKIQYCNDCRPPFPDVTVCNLNPLNSLLEFGNDVRDFDAFLDWIDYLSETELNLTQIMMELSLNMDQLQAVYEEAYSVSGYFQNINQSIVNRLASKSTTNKLIQHCKWYGWDKKQYPNENCMEKSIYTFYSPEYFACYTIHLNDTNHLSNKTDISSLQTTLYLNDFAQKRMRSIPDNIFQTQARGARVLIHPPNTLPDMSRGFNVPAGHEIIIKLSANQNQRLGEPYSICTEKQYLDSTEASKDDPYSVAFQYTDEACLSLCHQEISLKDCKCFNPHYPYSDRMMKEYPSLPQCGYVGNNINEAILRIWCSLFVNSNAASGTNNCSCVQPCNEYSYNYQLLQSPWPHETYHMIFYETKVKSQAYKDYFDVYEEIKKIYVSNISLAFEELKKVNLIERNFIELKVLFQNEGHEINTDIPAVTFDAFFGSMGGILNLWIGITFFTVIEFFDLVYRLTEGMFQKGKAWKKTEKDTTNRTMIEPFDDPERPSVFQTRW